MIYPQTINVREKMMEIIPRRSYATHNIDRYPAKMIPQIARFGIQKCSKPGDLVLDPFCGCGTVLVESRIMGRKARGIDINPLAVLLASTKSNLYQEKKLKCAIYQVVELAKHNKMPSVGMPSWIDYWFSPVTLKQLLLLRNAIEYNEYELSPPYINALKAILAVTVRLSSKADPRSPKPFISKKARFERVGVDFDAFYLFIREGNLFVKAAEEFRSMVINTRSSGSSVFCDDSRKLVSSPRSRVFDAVVSSPPYLSAQDYYRSSKLEITILGLMEEKNLHELGPSMIGSGRGEQDKNALSKLISLPREIKELDELNPRSAKVVAGYLNDMTHVIHGCHKHLREGGHCCLIIGDSTIQKIKLPVHKWITIIAEQAGFCFEEHYIDIVKDRRVPSQRKGHTSIIDQEHILIFKKTNNIKSFDKS